MNKLNDREQELIKDALEFQRDSLLQDLKQDQHADDREMLVAEVSELNKLITKVGTL